MKPTKEEIDRTQCPKCRTEWHKHDETTRGKIRCPTRDPRPDDMVELARLVAKELRKRGIWATHRLGEQSILLPIYGYQSTPGDPSLGWMSYRIYEQKFANLTPSECADVIQREEAAKAKEWAGDAE